MTKRILPLRPPEEPDARAEALLMAADRAERLVLLARDLLWVGTVAALQLQVLTDGVVEQSHGD